MGVRSQVRRTIEKYSLLSAGDRVVVAVSGGPDSMALLHLLTSLRRELALHIEVAHVMHGIRGEEAKQDARFVAESADKLGLRFHLKEVDVPGERARQGKGNIEAIGREKRYDFFAAVMRESHCNKVATGHTRDDQVETMLMWLLRGGGRGSLGGIPPLRSLTATAPGKGRRIIRPLIEVSKKDIILYLKKEKLPYRLDRTNRDPAYLRNWIRSRLLPELRRRTDSRLDLRLAQFSEIVRDEEALLESYSRERLKRVLRKERLDVEALLREEKALQRRLIRLWFAQSGGGLQGLTFDRVEACLRLLAQGPAQGRISLPGGMQLAREYGFGKVQRKTAAAVNAAGYHYTLLLNDDLKIPDAGVRIRSSVHAGPRVQKLRNHWKALFDLKDISAPLTVRNFRTGDRFRPFGMKGRKKLKNLFIDLKVPSEVRRTWPFLLSGEEILWIPGYARSDLATVRTDTRRVLRVEARSLLS